jgi:L-lactate utilization protein LutB
MERYRKGVEAKKWYVDQRLEKTLAALKKNGFQVFSVPTKQDALEKILELIPTDALVGIPGTMTIREIGLIEALVARGNHVAQHWPAQTSEESLAMMKQELNSDVFVTSVNAITYDGKLVDEGQTGNRVAAMVFGPSKVIVVAGFNKIVRDVEDGIQRIKKVAAPMNAKRMGRKTPCVLTLECKEVGCKLPERVCRMTTIIKAKPGSTDFTIILVGETLGF